ncbi:MAG TPA: hypothetical protein VNJ07_04765, partial [Chitinophagales bacterium]|nr:hypothetical protein [Chitinophagales bacterium]
MFRKSAIPVYLFVGLMISTSIIFRASQNIPQPSQQPVSFNVFSKIEAVSLPDAETFAGEAVPLDNFDVRERLDRELLVNTYWHSNTLQLFKLASRYFPVIEAILKENGV